MITILGLLLGVCFGLPAGFLSGYIATLYRAPYSVVAGLALGVYALSITFFVFLAALNPAGFLAVWRMLTFVPVWRFL